MYMCSPPLLTKSLTGSNPLMAKVNCVAFNHTVCVCVFIIVNNAG